MPRLDPTGEHILVPPGSPLPSFPPGASPIAPPVGPNTGVSLSPSALIAPVGSEVLMIASVVGGEGYLLTNEVVEWTIDPNSAGQFLSPGERRRLDVLNWWRGLPKKIDSRYAVNSTLKYPKTLDRGTPSPYDDFFVQTGQAWVTLTSATEGMSRVTAFAPAIAGWELRQQSATIYWIDAQWRFPPPTIGTAGGKNSLVTTVARQTTGMPLPGWQVRYEIAGGPEAGFAPDGATSIQIVTNEAGQAPVEIVQRTPVAGTNQINISVIQPTGADPQGPPLTVGAGSTLQTWAVAGAPLPTLEAQPTPVFPPPPGAVPSPAAPGTAAPSLPPATAPPLGAAPPATVPPTITPTAPPAAQAELDVIVSGPNSATVGDTVQFQIQVTNRGTAVASNLLVRDKFDDGLAHSRATGSIDHDMADLQPGGTAQLSVNFRVTKPGQWCQEVEITGAGGLTATARHCLTAASPPISPPAAGEQRWEGQPGVQPTPAEPPSQAPAAGAPAAAGQTLVVRMTGPSRRNVGELALFSIEVTNRGSTALDDLVIANNFETSLEPGRATEGNVWLEGNALGWRVGSLAAGQTLRRDIEMRCLQETPRACNRVTVTARATLPVAEEACLEIVGQRAATAPQAASTRRPLRVSVAETADPLRVGGKSTYQILVENLDTASYFDVVVSATLTPELKVDTIAGPVGTQGQVLPTSLRFTPIRELRAGEAPLSFELHVTAAQAGAAAVKVEVTSKDQAQPVKAEQTTQVLP
ncbi:MAG: hypothetical protein AB7O59_12185 [Pirellulales bacterium]